MARRKIIIRGEQRPEIKLAELARALLNAARVQDTRETPEPKTEVRRD